MTICKCAQLHWETKCCWTGRKARWLLLSIGSIVSAQNALNWKVSHCGGCSSGVFLQRRIPSKYILGDCTAEVSTTIRWWNVSGSLFTAVLLMPFRLKWSGSNFTKLQFASVIISMCEKCTSPNDPTGSRRARDSPQYHTLFKRPLFQVWWSIQIKYMYPDIVSYFSGFSSTMFSEGKRGCKLIVLSFVQFQFSDLQYWFAKCFPRHYILKMYCKFLQLLT